MYAKRIKLENKVVHSLCMSLMCLESACQESCCRQNGHVFFACPAAPFGPGEARLVVGGTDPGVVLVVLVGHSRIGEVVKCTGWLC